MKQAVKSIIKKALRIKPSPRDAFTYFEYLRHDQRRLEHLASLGLPIAGSSVLEVGAGIGGHTSFFLDRGCRVVSTEARPENLEVLRTRYPGMQVKRLDLDNPDSSLEETFDIVHCYGVLYHLKKPAGAIEYMSTRCRKLLLLETCVSPGDEESLNPCPEPEGTLSQSVHGIGCRPTRSWVFNQLNRHFEFVYMPATQPNHSEFPVDWTSSKPNDGLVRSVFIASRQQLENPFLVTHVPMRQRRH
jgi:SAM-dependent methyltransferase